MATALPIGEVRAEELPSAPGAGAGAPSALTAGRLVSLDVFRGLVIVVMTLVNYLSPVRQIPAWAKHRPEALEGYTFVDVVFPAFLFMVGLAIPFAFQRRIDRGDSPLALVGKSVLRSAALVLLGVITVNEHSYSAEAAALSKPLWSLLTMLCAVAIWSPIPALASPDRRGVQWGVQAAAGIGLLVLLCLFRGKNAAGQIVWLQHAWWGMLGMIGWAYLASSLCWLLFRNNSSALMGVMCFMLVLFVGGRHGALDWLGPVKKFLNVGVMFGSNAATVMMGVLAANCLQKTEEVNRASERLKFLLVFGLGLYLAGSLLRPLHGINKSAHTESYALVTGGICCLVFAVVYYLVDVKGVKGWVNWLVPLGQNALLAYLLPGMVGDVVGLFGRRVYWADSGLPGFWNAAALTAAILVMISFLSRRGIRMRL